MRLVKQIAFIFIFLATSTQVALCDPFCEKVFKALAEKTLNVSEADSVKSTFSSEEEKKVNRWFDDLSKTNGTYQRVLNAVQELNLKRQIRALKYIADETKKVDLSSGVSARDVSGDTHLIKTIDDEMVERLEKKSFEIRKPSVRKAPSTAPAWVHIGAIVEIPRSDGSRSIAKIEDFIAEKNSVSVAWVDAKGVRFTKKVSISHLTKIK